MKSANKVKSMRNLKRLVCLTALTGIFAAPLQAHDNANSGYIHDKDGNLVLDSLGECIKSSWWSSEVAIPKCEGMEEVKVSDADQDGIADNSDKCPGTPAGVSVDSRGCAKDSDKDGVMDSADNCPGTASGVAVDSSGCEIFVAAAKPKDSDNDGVADLKDKCPNTKPGVNVDTAGCELRKSFVLKGVNFITGSDEITAASRSVLDEVAKTLIKNGDISVEVAGYTDDRGEWDFNQSLSQKRAESVKAYLRSAGVAANRMKAKGYGEAKPIGDNSTSAGRAINRRVELHIIE
jgi:OOP family OmpA-OmpF porin